MEKIDIERVLRLFVERGALARVLQSHIPSKYHNTFIGVGFSLFGATDIPSLKASSLVTLLKMEAEKNGDNVVELTAVLAPKAQGYSCFKANGQTRDIIITAIGKETNV